MRAAVVCILCYPRSGNGRSLSCARAWFHKASSTQSGCVLGDTAREAKSLVESMTDTNRRSAIPESRVIEGLLVRQLFRGWRRRGGISAVFFLIAFAVAAMMLAGWHVNQKQSFL